jgi:hypothetical protein
MTDRELIERALKFFDWFYSDDHTVGRKNFRSTHKALRDRLAKPEREWVGLKDEEIHDYSIDLWPSESTFENGAKWAEAKLKDKNT